MERRTTWRGGEGDWEELFWSWSSKSPAPSWWCWQCWDEEVTLALDSFINESMALNAAHNYRLESPQILLENLVRTVQFQLDVSHRSHSVFSFYSGFQLLYHRVKVILKHGARVKHHLVSGTLYSNFRGSAFPHRFFPTWQVGTD